MAVFRFAEAACLAIATMVSAVTPVAAREPGRWVRSWAAAPMTVASNRAPGAPVVPLTDVTFRTTVRLSAAGTALRLRLSNENSGGPLVIDAVRVAIVDGDGAIRPGDARVVTFGGGDRVTIPIGAPLLSDPVALPVPALARLSISLHVPGDAAGATAHHMGLATTEVAPGDQTAAATLRGAVTTTMRYIVSGVDVLGDDRAATIVALGDSITDGAQGSVDSNSRWPDTLAERLAKAGITDLAVANAGISGNRLIDPKAGQPALARLDRDALSVPGVRYVILLEGINDVMASPKPSWPTPVTAADVIGAYQQIIQRAHDRGVKVIGGTLTPFKKAGGFPVPAAEPVRRAINDWIRAPGHFDGVVDFERAVADPADAYKLAAPFDSGDALHPSDAGYRAMGAAIPLSLFAGR